MRVGRAPRRAAASAANAVAATTSTGSTILPPAARQQVARRCRPSRPRAATADLVALGLEEGEAHAAADEQPVDLGQQRLDHGQLVGDLGAAEHHHVRPLGLAGQPRQHLDLAQHQPAGVVRQQRRHVVDAGVLAVHRAERVVDVRVAERGELVGEGAPLGVVLAGLARVEAQVLQQRHLAVGRARPRWRGRSRRPCRWRTRPARRAARRAARRPAPGVYFGSGAPFGRPRCEQTTTRAPASRSASSVGSTARIRPSSVIAPVLLVERDVQVGAHQHAPTSTPPRRAGRRGSMLTATNRPA